MYVKTNKKQAGVILDCTIRSFAIDDKTCLPYRLRDDYIRIDETATRSLSIFFF